MIIRLIAILTNQFSGPYHIPSDLFDMLDHTVQVHANGLAWLNYSDTTRKSKERNQQTHSYIKNQFINHKIVKRYL